MKIIVNELPDGIQLQRIPLALRSKVGLCSATMFLQLSCSVRSKVHPPPNDKDEAATRRSSSYGLRRLRCGGTIGVESVGWPSSCGSGATAR
ncbi:hypothetical protein SESBI_48207 [Sesbania bispinosa]|nr:hypothetical protein SESBI_48207 [Sesbania bispinosa]